MHSTERRKLILDLLTERGFASFKVLEQEINASAATLRRDLEELSKENLLIRVRGGAKPTENTTKDTKYQISGSVNTANKIDIAIGKAAANLCHANESIIIDGCAKSFAVTHAINGLNLQVLTQSIDVANILHTQKGTKTIVLGGMLLENQNIISPSPDIDLSAHYYCPKIFTGGTAIAPQGLLQSDSVLAGISRNLIDHSPTIIVTANSKQFLSPSGSVVCDLSRIHTLITDEYIRDNDAKILENTDVNLIIT